MTIGNGIPRSLKVTPLPLSLFISPSIVFSFHRASFHQVAIFEFNGTHPGHDIETSSNNPCMEGLTTAVLRMRATRWKVISVLAS
jgi:hypothetical protein